MNFEDRRQESTQAIEQILKQYLPVTSIYQKTVADAMEYSLMAGGKRLRPMLMQETYRLFGGQTKVIEPFMAAIEMIHTYSLVHDDLPAMDDDEYRRGRKATHIVYGEWAAILAGDALLNYAFETALTAFSITRDSTDIPKALMILANKAGIYGMIGGQNADIEAEGSEAAPNLEVLMFIHENKTAALIESAMMIGAVLAGATEEQVSVIGKIARNVGLAFQIQDDILDVTGNLETLGKQTGSDVKNNKITYVTLVGLEKAGEEVMELSKEAIGLLQTLPYQNPFLEALLQQLVTRQK